MTTTELAPDPAIAKTVPPDERFAHLVLKQDWPVALCGFTVTDRLGAKTPGFDRCPACLKIAAAGRLGRPGWV